MHYPVLRAEAIEYLAIRPEGVYLDATAGLGGHTREIAGRLTTGFVMANGSLASNQSGEGDIRKAMVEADLVDCIVALPGQLFYTTQIPA